MPGMQPKNTWALVVSAVVAVVLVAGVVALDSLYASIDGVIRFGAVLGYLGVFLTALSSNYMRELTRFFGRPFPKVHHMISITAMSALSVHAIAVAWRAGTPATFVPDVSSVRAFFERCSRRAGGRSIGSTTWCFSSGRCTRC